MSDVIEWLQPQPCLDVRTLKHSWLENVVCADGMSVRLSDRHWNKFYDLCLGYLSKCEQMLERYQSEVSPASLLTKLKVFSCLPTDFLDRWGKELDLKFQEKYCIEQRLEDVALAAVYFKDVLKTISRAHSGLERATPQNQAALSTAGHRLKEALAKLPTWIPPL